jgi:hypothetical protein
MLFKATFRFGKTIFFEQKMATNIFSNNNKNIFLKMV